jgi:hypothetical protein
MRHSVIKSKSEQSENHPVELGKIEWSKAGKAVPICKSGRVVSVG